jgi:excisionase family DNA binding protein
MEILLPLICLFPLIFGALLTTKQASDLLGISVRGIHSLIKRGRLRADKFGRDWMIKREDLDLFKENKRSKGRPKKTDPE